MFICGGPLPGVWHHLALPVLKVVAPGSFRSVVGAALHSRYISAGDGRAATRRHVAVTFVPKTC